VLISGNDPKQTPMNKPLRIGLIGAGMVSCHHLIALRLVEACYRLSGWEAAR